MNKITAIKYKLIFYYCLPSTHSTRFYKRLIKNENELELEIIYKLCLDVLSI